MPDKVLIGETLRGGKAELDLQELITGRTLLCSISRWGKTWTARRIVEQVFGKTGIIIVDVEGEYATLRDRYPLLIIGKDVAVVPESAEFLADQILEHDLSAIVDGSDPQLDIATFQEFLARGIDGFFQEGKGIGKIMAELVRRYNVGDSGGNRTTVNDRLGMLVSRGILDRKQEAGQWVYLESPEFAERVRKR